METRTCDVEDCDRVPVANGLCGMHYQRLRKTGTTDPRPERLPRYCSVEGCEKRADVPGAALGYCGMHYYRFKTTGDPLVTLTGLKPKSVCSVEGCEQKHWSGGLCAVHHQRLKRLGTTDLPIRPSPVERFLSKVGEPNENGCREWLGAHDKDGYGDFVTNGRKIRSHRFAYEQFVGPIPEGLHILHSCDNPPCCEPSHLRAGTRSDNVQDALERGLWNPARGTRNPRAVLNDDLVRKIRELHSQGYGARKQSRMLNINEGTIRGVLHGGNWSHVK